MFIKYGNVDIFPAQIFPLPKHKTDSTFSKTLAAKTFCNLDGSDLASGLLWQGRIRKYNVFRFVLYTHKGTKAIFIVEYQSCTAFLSFFRKPHLEWLYFAANRVICLQRIEEGIV